MKASHATPAIVVAERFSRTNIFYSDNRSATAFAEVASKALRECACGPSVVWFKPKINFISRRFWHSVVATFAELGKNRRQQTKLLYYVLKGLLHTEKLFHFVCGIWFWFVFVCVCHFGCLVFTELLELAGSQCTDTSTRTKSCANFLLHDFIKSIIYFGRTSHNECKTKSDYGLTLTIHQVSTPLTDEFLCGIIYSFWIAWSNRMTHTPNKMHSKE